MTTVLIVDDKESLRDSVGATLQRAGMSVVTAVDGPAALALIAKKRPDCVVSDLKMPGMTGIELLKGILQIDNELPFILMTAFGTVQTAVEAMRLGAYHYLLKPFEGDELIIAVKRAVEHAKVVRENAVLRSDPSAARTTADEPAIKSHGVDRIIGESDAMRRVKEQVRAIAASHGTVLICGESGTGKEVVARAIHEASPRAGAAFLAVNCAALSESLLESELFGHERGAFTGAEKLRKGRFELADGGTLLLDEVSEVGAQIQAKLLRVLQERAFERVGSSLTIGIDVRIVATSNRDLPKEVDAGTFRSDLYYRLNVLPIHIPPLRERLEDVPVLAAHFAAQICRREGRTALMFDDAALALMQSYPWPGNVRELQNICERAVVLGAGNGGRVGKDLIAPWLVGRATPTISSTTFAEIKPGNGSSHGGHASAPAASEGRTLEDVEREAVVSTLQRFNGHRQRTAAALGIGVRTLGLKLKKWKEQHLIDERL